MMVSVENRPPDICLSPDHENETKNLSVATVLRMAFVGLRPVVMRKCVPNMGLQRLGVYLMLKEKN